MKHVAVYRAACIVKEAEILRQRIEEVSGPPADFERLEQKYRFVPEAKVGNMNYAVQVVEFSILHELGEAQSTVRYLGSKLNGGITAVEASASPSARSLFKAAGFAVHADHLAVGWRFQTRTGVTIEIYVPSNAVVADDPVSAGDKLVWTKGADILPSNQFLCELVVKCDPADLPKRKAVLEGIFADLIKPHASSDLTVIEL